jgi:hypothetical protein
VASTTLTLTYGRDDDDSPDHMRAYALTYSDVGEFFLRLRDDGFRFRFFVAGEYGSKKGRAHWHILMFWLTKPPPYEERKNFQQKHWNHGYSYWETVVKPETVSYVMKYLQKTEGDGESRIKTGMSRHPPLGADYFKQLAEKYVKQGLAPQDPFYYSFPDVKDAKGKPFQFHLHKTSLDLFLNHYIRASGGPRRTGNSAKVDNMIDKNANYAPSIKPRVFKGRVPYPFEEVPYASAIRKDDYRNTYYCEVGKSRLYWVTDIDGNWVWRDTATEKAVAKAAARALALRADCETKTI